MALLRPTYPTPPTNEPWGNELIRALVARDSVVDTAIASKASFQATASAGTVFTAGTLATAVFDAASFDPTTRYDTTAGQFNAPERGLYNLSAQLTGTASASSDWELQLVTTHTTFKRVFRSVPTSTYTLSIVCPVVYMGKGDTAEIKVNGLTGTDTFTLNADIAYNFFMGFHVCPI